MKKKIISIDEEKCIGCGLCANACQEGAIQMIDGKAKLVREDYCDGLGNCLPVCPTDAISFTEKEVDMSKVKGETKMKNNKQGEQLPCGCPGTNSKEIKRGECCQPAAHGATTAGAAQKAESELMQWPVQIKLVPVNAPYFDGANLLVAADCTAFSYGNFHADFIKNHITLIGCPKLDEGDYTEKLSEIIKNNDIKSVKVVKMEVPCCTGIATAVKNALIKSEKMIPWQIVTISTDGQIIE